MKNKDCARANLWRIIGTLEGCAYAIKSIGGYNNDDLAEGLQQCAETLQQLSVQIFEDEHEQKDS